MDVLAVIDHALSLARKRGAAKTIRDLEEARAAVAELVADGWNMVAGSRHTGQPIDTERLAAALSKLGGGK
jgi:hypothetical protein